MGPSLCHQPRPDRGAKPRKRRARRSPGFIRMEVGEGVEKKEEKLRRGSGETLMQG